MLFSTCLRYTRTARYEDPRKSHAVQLMTVLTRGLLSKSDLAGWEVMELFAGGVNESDKFFNVLMFGSLLYTLLTKDFPRSLPLLLVLCLAMITHQASPIPHCCPCDPAVY